MAGASQFKHTPLDRGIDCIRLVVLEPSISFASPIVCKLNVAVFGQKPKYQALSYTWGTDVARNKIVLNDSEFLVRDNLFQALKHLRRTDEDRTLWIDAICINQNNLPERNGQLPLMPYIYTRAQTVVVWLGSDLVPEFAAMDLSNYDNVSQGVRLQKLGDYLCQREYWQRVWIIQEIGKARKIEVCYGHQSESWNAFLQTASHSLEFSASRPKLLSDQINDKYGEAHKLQSLLKTHESALCDEPRDKIYGLVGLATDTYAGFPMDYGKDLFEVYTDVMLFKNHSQLDGESAVKPNYDMIPFSRLVQRSLGGRSKIIPPPRFFNKYAPHSQWKRMAFKDAMVLERGSKELQYPMILEVMGNIVGRIKYVGPTYKDIISKFSAVVRWKKSLRKYLPPTSHQSADEENDYFLETLENMEDEDHDKVFSFKEKIWYHFNAIDRVPPSIARAFKNGSREIEYEGDRWRSEDGNVETQRLFVLSDNISRSPSPRMGLAPPNAQEGDCICEFSGGEQCAILRWNGVTGFIVVGSAVMAEQTGRARDRRRNDTVVETKFNVPIFDHLDENEQCPVYMDSVTLWKLSR